MPVGVSKVQICNMALSSAGSRSSIESLSEKNTPANLCRVWYDVARIAVLEAYDWGFARKNVAPALHSVAAPTNRWAYRYQYPTDCLAVRLVENPLGTDADAIPFCVEEADDDTKSVLTDQGSAVLIYTRDLEGVSRFSMHFTLTLALQLSVFIIPELSGKESRRDRVLKQLGDALFQAPEIDNSESVPKAPRDSAQIRARA